MQRRGIDQTKTCAGVRLPVIVPCGSSANQCGLARVIQRCRQLGRIRWEVETHVYDVSPIADGVVDRMQDVGEVTRAIGTEGLQWQQKRARRD